LGGKNYETTSLKNQSDIHRELILNQLSTVVLISSFPAGPMNFPNQETGARGQGASKEMLIIKLKIYVVHSGHRKANLMLNDPKYPPKKGAAGSPLNCRVKTGGNQSNLEFTRFKQHFPWAWTPLPLESENRNIKQVIGARIGLIFPAPHA
jgi:hypothetical protein